MHVFKAISLLSVSIAGVLGQDDSEAPSLAPSAGPNECDAFEAGDFAFVFVNSVDPGDELSLFLFNDVPAGMKLYLTDNAWTGSTFQSDEGSLEVSGRFCVATDESQKGCNGSLVRFLVYYACSRTQPGIKLWIRSQLSRFHLGFGAGFVCT